MIIRNIGPFEKAIYNFNAYQKCLIMGINHMSGMTRNGVGKSMIPDILTWILWEKTNRGISKDSMLRDGADQGYASIYINKGKFNYKITRYRGKQNNLTFERFSTNGEKDKLFRGIGKTARDTQYIINENLGITFDTFTSVAYFGQGTINKFLSGSSSEREKVITEFFDLHIWDKLKESVKKRFSESNNQIEKYNISIDSWKKTIADIDAEEIAKKKSQLHIEKNNLELRINKLKKTQIKAIEYDQLVKDNDKCILSIETLEATTNTKIVSIQENIKKNRQIIEQIPLIKSKLAIRSKTIEKVELFENQIEELENQLRIFSQSKATCIASRESCEQNIIELDKLIKTLSDKSECPTCGQELTPDCRQALLSKKNKNKGHSNAWLSKANKISEKIKDLEDTIDSLREKIDNHQEQINQIQLLEYKLKQALNNKQEEKNFKIEILNIGKDKEKRLNILKKEQTQIKIKFNKIGKKFGSNDIQTITEKLNRMFVSLSKFNSDINFLKQQLAQYRSAIRKIEEMNTNVIEEKNNIVVYEYLKNAFPSIKMSIVDNINYELEDLINSKLSTDMGIDIRIKFDTEWDKKSGEGKIAKYDIRAEQRGQKERLWESFSGGEKQRIALAVYFAFQQLAEKQISDSVNVLILDEVFMALDAVGKESCMKLIQEIKSNKNIHIITHLEDVMAKFKTIEQIIVEKHENGISTIKRAA